MRVDEPIIIIAPMSERIRYQLSMYREYRSRLERLSDALNIAIAVREYEEVFDDIVIRYSDTPDDFRTNCYVFSHLIVALEMVIGSDITRIEDMTTEGMIPYVRDMEIQDSWWIASIGFKPYLVDES